MKNLVVKLEVSLLNYIYMNTLLVKCDVNLVMKAVHCPWAIKKKVKHITVVLNVNFNINFKTVFICARYL